MLKMTGEVIHNIQDIDMQLMLEKGLRGGLSYIGMFQNKLYTLIISYFKLFFYYFSN